MYKGTEDPDDAFSSIPYEKGSNFLLHLEQTVGGLDNFLPYARSYFLAFYNRSVSTEEWKEHLYSFYSSSPEISAKLNKVDWEAWLNGEGLELPVKMVYDTSLADEAFKLAGRWSKVIEGKVDPSSEKFSSEDIKNLDSNQIVAFLEKLYGSGAKVPPKIVKLLNDSYGFADSNNAEIRFRFYEVALEVEGGEFARQAAEWVKGMGRMKFCRATFRALYKVEPELARKTFLGNKSFYHPIAAALLAKVSKCFDCSHSSSIEIQKVKVEEASPFTLLLDFNPCSRRTNLGSSLHRISSFEKTEHLNLGSQTKITVSKLFAFTLFHVPILLSLMSFRLPSCSRISALRHRRKPIPSLLKLIHLVSTLHRWSLFRSSDQQGPESLNWPLRLREL